MIGAADIDILPVVDLQGHGGEGLHQPGQVLGGSLRQVGLLQHFVRLKIVDGRPVGQHRRGVHGDQRGIGGKGAVRPAGGHDKIAPLPDKIADGLQIALRDAQVQAVQCVVKVAGQQQTIKFSHRGLLSPLGGAKAVFFQF